MFGMPYHSITAHFAEWFRLIPLRSLNAENQERVFKDIKNSTDSTNFNHEHLLINALIRLQVKTEEGVIGKSFTSQENDIKKEWSRMPIRRDSRITLDMIEEDRTSFAHHKLRISDYLVEGIWHTIGGDGWSFNDGDRSEIISSIPQLMHFR